MENRIIVDYKLVECKNVDDLTQTLVKYSTEQDKD